MTVIDKGNEDKYINDIETYCKANGDNDYSLPMGHILKMVKNLGDKNMINYLNVFFLSDGDDCKPDETLRISKELN